MKKVPVNPVVWLVAPDDHLPRLSPLTKPIRQGLGPVFSLQSEQRDQLQVSLGSQVPSPSQAKETLVVYILEPGLTKPPRHNARSGLSVGMRYVCRGDRRREFIFYGPDGQKVIYEENLSGEGWLGAVVSREGGDLPFLELTEAA